MVKVLVGSKEGGVRRQAHRGAVLPMLGNFYAFGDGGDRKATLAVIESNQVKHDPISGYQHENDPHTLYRESTLMRGQTLRGVCHGITWTF